MRRLLERRTHWEPRFLEGTVRELEELFGGRLPELPGRGLDFLVDLHPGLRKSLRDLLEAVLPGLTARAAEGLPPGADETRGRFEEALEGLLVAVIERERRLGFFNLFWLAHSRDVVELLGDVLGRPGLPPGLKYRIHPLLQGPYRAALTRVLSRLRARPDHFLQRALGAEFNTSLIDTIIDDQLPLVEPAIEKLSVSQVLAEGNRRFRLSLAEFREVMAVARERLREARERREPRLMDVLRRTLPGLRVEQLEDERLLSRVLFSSRVLTVLLPGSGGPERAPSRRGGKSRSWAETVADYLDFTQAVKRTEVVDRLRRQVRLVGVQASADTRVAYDEGRLYRFHPGAEVVSLARKITILFADLRGFTRASERGVSEREITSELYAVFDPLAGIVARYEGRIDKFTGDGVMVTFGSDGVTPRDELNALRTALDIQGLMAGLRRAGRTSFDMGISVHTGRAELAHFIVDDRQMDRTVIGRNVNIAGRLSGSGKTSAFEEGDPGEEAIGAVWVDADGTLYNMGIVVSQDTVEALLPTVDATVWQGRWGRGFRFPDADFGKIILLEYVGDAKFKGVGRAIAIYRLGAEQSLGTSQVGEAG
jgi:class 3 adenylate cyclase